MALIDPEFGKLKLPFPSVSHVERLLSRLGHSAPGPGGIPYGAWRAAGREGAETLWQLLCWTASGGAVPLGMAASLLAFLPKDIDSSEGNELVRVPSCTRPLGLKNTSLKIVGALLSDAVNPTIAREAHPCQMGLCERQRLHPEHH